VLGFSIARILWAGPVGRADAQGGFAGKALFGAPGRWPMQPTGLTLGGTCTLVRLELLILDVDCRVVPMEGLGSRTLHAGYGWPLRRGARGSTQVLTAPNLWMGALLSGPR